jgi:hypothetical protein
MPAARLVQCSPAMPVSIASEFQKHAPPMMAGIDIKNEKSAAVLRLSPVNSAPEIVLPERDTAGKHAPTPAYSQ